MKILMVGAGAVGQVFGIHLQRAGADLAFYARPGSAARLKKALNGDGLPIYQVSRRHRRNTRLQRLRGYRVITDLDSARDFEPDQLWFTTPSPVYHTPWFTEFVQEVACERVVCFAPEGRRTEFLPPGEAGRFVFGGITLIAWQGDLGGGGGRVDGVNYWLPPFGAIPLMGEPAVCREVAGFLAQGGLRAAARDESFQAVQASTTALLTTLTAGLELAGWSLRRYRRSPWLRQAACAAREAITGQLARPGFAARAALRFGLSPAVLSLATYLLPALTPFDLEKYLAFHYTKTREQTLILLELFAEDAIEGGHEAEHLQALLAALGEPRPQA